MAAIQAPNANGCSATVATTALIRRPHVQGLLIEGNFLFDPLSPEDLRKALQAMGVDADNIGDLWVRGDRGGQGICSFSAAETLHGRLGAVREVEIRCEARPLEQLQQPVLRSIRTLQTVEASCRLDAIASAGFGLSRAKIVYPRESWASTAQLGQRASSQS